MWYTAENSSSVKPKTVDQDISAKYVFVRKNFEEVPTLDVEGEETGTHWRYEETKVKKEAYEIFKTASDAEMDAKQNAANIDYVAMMTGIEL